MHLAVLQWLLVAASWPSTNLLLILYGKGIDTTTTCIFRDVTLRAFNPAGHIEDFYIVSEVAGDSAKVHLTVTTARLRSSALINIDVGAAVADAPKGARSEVSPSDPTSIPIPNARLWTAETPYLYNVTIDLSDGKDKITQKIGLREVQLINGNITVNGREFSFVA
ncbi:hypothetical protein V1506DRAFT_503567 [Lipomyces tetrasporus]